MTDQSIPEFAQSSQLSAVETRQDSHKGDLPLEDVTAERRLSEFIKQQAITDAYLRGIAGLFDRLTR